MNQKYIDSLHMKAFEVIKKAFKKPADLIQWASYLSDSIYAHAKKFTYKEQDQEGDMDVHFEVILINNIGIAWIENNHEDISHAVSCLRENFNKVLLSGLSALAWERALNGEEGIDFIDTFKKLSALYPIFEEVDEAWEALRNNLKKVS